MEIHPVDEKFINDFALKIYGKKCYSFSSFCDGEPYGKFAGITGAIKLPLSVVQEYKEGDILKVNQNGTICIRNIKTKKRNNKTKI